MFFAGLLLTPGAAWANPEGDPEQALQALELLVNNVWMLVATVLVFAMHLGFATLEAGLTQAKNTVNILFKNLCVVAIGLLTYAGVGFSLMYPGEAFAGGVIGFAGFGLQPPADAETFAYADGAYTYWTDFLFQGMFAATAATIVSGAVAERARLDAFLIFSTLFVALVYPIVGMWQWGGGWLAARGFHDFAGSTVVHGVGGWGALAGAIVLGPRLGKYREPFAIVPIRGHSMPLATVGTFLLWFGWFGFNGGSVLSAEAGAISRVLVVTALGGAGGIVTAAATSWQVQGKPDLSMALNGALGGLVAVTAGADVISPGQAVLLGLSAGTVVVVAVMLFDRLRLDDPVGAISVHLVCGAWGTVAVGVLVPEVSLVGQLVGVGAVGAFSFASAWGLFWALERTLGIRVGADEERRGLDIDEHGSEAYLLGRMS
ncbi:ammonium transporter [Plesiocystis pacifica SIR-1]|uniref:Ammonium transporter n=1 Tax=Plesiocystis pacifica SIR-1 TaxID=391625 RepID=A6GJF5_9BACT|nr:ammonium transporter [Plesiocystis pacifica]EDM73995.1 ammonium transporter [Plesiocystis pacifica SIR-1]